MGDLTYITSNLIFFVVSVFLIIKSASLFVKGAVDISTALLFSKAFIGVTIVSFVTSAPELAVSAISSHIGKTGLPEGNAIGSVLCNIGLVFSVGAILGKFSFNKWDLKYRIPFLFFAIFVAYVLSLDGVLGKKEAVYMLTILAIFFGHNYYLAIKEQKGLRTSSSGGKDAPRVKRSILFFFAGGFLTVVIARYGLIYTALNIANFFNVPHIVIGLSMVALGTSLPELFIMIAAKREGHDEISVGNVIGASILNILFVLSVAALIRPIAFDRQTITLTLPYAAVMVFVLFLLGIKGPVFGKAKAFVLLFMYFVYIFALYSFMYT